MKKLLYFICLILTLTPLSKAQNGYVTVKATVKDPTGALYVNSQVGAVFIDPGTSGKLPLLFGSTFQTNLTGYGTDSFANFSLQVADNQQIASSSGATGTVWRFTITYQDRATSFTYQTPIDCLDNIPVTCTNGTMDISVPLQAAAALLPTQGGGGLFTSINVVASATPTFNSGGNTTFNYTLNQAVTSSTFITNAPAGSGKAPIFQFNICENNVGGFGMIWPSNVTLPPGYTFSIAANTCSPVAFIYNSNTATWSGWQVSGGTSSSLILKVNNVNNGSQALLNLLQGTGVTLTDNGTGTITITNSGSTPAGPQGTIQAAGTGGAHQTTNLVESGTSLAVNDDTHFNTGPNPYVDAGGSNVRASASPTSVPNVPGVTASITGSPSTSVTISTNTCAAQAGGTCFQKGDAVTIFGAGPATGISAPAAPTVTPYNSQGGTNTGIGVASPTGSTAYQFCLSAVDNVQGQTACSLYTSITNGQASLGPQVQPVSSATLVNNVMTVITSAALPVSTGATCQVYGMNPSSFNYEGPTSSVSGTTITFNTNEDTRNGAAPTGAGGNVVCWTSLHIKGALPAGGVQTTRLAVYGGAGTATNFLGFMVPPAGIGSSDIAYLVFDWYGATFSPSIRPYYVASTSPSVATNDSLETTITNVSGTTLTLAANSTANVTNATILLDQSKNINACLVASGALGSSKCVLPATTGTFVLNTELDIPSSAVLEVAGANNGGGIQANDTIMFLSLKGRILGKPASNQQSGSSFSINSLPTLTCVQAWPCMEGQDVANVDYLQINLPDGAIGYVEHANARIPAHDWNYNYWNFTGNGYGSVGFYCVGPHIGGGNTQFVFKGQQFIASQLGPGSMQTPAFISHGCGNASFPETFFSGKGRFWRPVVSGMAIDVNTYDYSQANYMPFDTVYNVDGGNIGLSYFQHGQQVFDTTFAPLLATNSGITASVVGDSLVIGGGGGTITTGNGVIYFQNGATPGNGETGQNTNQIQGVAPSLVGDPVLGYNNKGIVKQDADLSLGPLYSMHTRELPPIAPVCVVSTGGNVPIGTVTYDYAYVYPDGGQGVISNACSVTTTTGNQTVTVTAPALLGASYAYWRSTGGNYVLVNISGCAVSQTGSNVYVDVSSFTCGTSQPGYPDSGPAGIRSSQVWSKISSVMQYEDVTETPAPANPASGNERWFANQTTHQLSCLTSAGVSCTPFGAVPGGAINASQYNLDNVHLGGVLGNVTGQVLTAVHNAPPNFLPPGIVDGNGGSPITTTPYPVQCDDTTTNFKLLDRLTRLRLRSGASVVTVPLSTNTGCSAGFVFTLIDDGAGSITVNSTSPDVLTVCNGGTCVDNLTTFNLINGQYVTLNQGASGLWEALITTSAAATTNAQNIQNGFTCGTTCTSGNLACFVATNAVGNCTAFPSANYIGVFYNGTGGVQSIGLATLNLDASVNVTFGDKICFSSASDTGHDFGTGVCPPGIMVGTVQTTASSVSSATVFLTPR